jgi:hypothetical protein
VKLRTSTSGLLQNSFLVWVSNSKIGGLYGKLWGMFEHHLNFTYVEDTQASGLSLRVLLKLPFGF